MKNVYLYIVFLLIVSSGYGQDLRNSNWLFGDQAWLKFSGSPIAVSSISGSPMDVWEGCASVSDENGNLLFYTNGMTVWSNNHQPMLNGNNTLTSSESNTQGVIIVPKPGNDKMYYVVYIDGNTGGKKGLRYSEVNMSTSLGQVITSSRNTVLKDHNGVYINESYNNGSEKLTCAKHANGVDYWVVTCIRDYIYSYLVTSTGISLYSYVAAPINILPVNDQQSSADTGPIKISRDNQKIAICYNKGYNNTPYGAIAKGTFDSMTGQVVINYPIISTYGMNPYGMEFSPNSNNIYFNNITGGQYQRKLYVITTSNSFTEVGIFNTGSTNNPGTMQLGIDNKIYIAKFQGNNLAVISNPDNAGNPNFQDSPLTLSYGANDGGLPQFVPWQGKCPSDLVLTSTTHDVLAPAQDNRQAQNTIIASNKINNGAIGIYHAGEDIVFKPGFSSANGSVFRAYIEGCSNEFEGLMAPVEEATMRTASVDEESEKELFTLYPNPGIESVIIASDKLMQNITVTSLDGFTLFQGDVRANSYDLNISNYRKGIYVITVVTEDGQMEMKKLIKE